MEPHETYLEAALVHADADAAMRQQVVDAIREVVHDEMERMFRNGTVDPFVYTVIRNSEFEIKRMAMRAIKEHFQNPQQIY